MLKTLCSLQDLCGIIVRESHMVPDIWVDDIINAKPGMVHRPILQAKVEAMEVPPVGEEVKAEHREDMTRGSIVHNRAVRLVIVHVDEEAHGWPIGQLCVGVVYLQVGVLAST